MRKRIVHQMMQVTFAVTLSALLVVGLAGTALGQKIVSPIGAIDEPPVTVVQIATPNTTVTRGGVVSYEIITTARHGGGVGNVTVTMPFDPAKIAILEAQFSKSEAWVSSLQNGLLVFETGRVGQNEPVKAFIRALVLDGVPDGVIVAEPLQYTWVYGDSSGVATSNRPQVMVGAAHQHRTEFPLAVGPQVAPQGTVRNVVSEPVFSPFETVHLWYNHPGWSTQDVGMVAADAEGKVSINFDTSMLGNGDYSLVAYGLWTGFTSVGPLTVGTPAPAPAPAPSAEVPAPAPGDAVPACIACHSKPEHNVQAPHPQQPMCTDCHGESKPAITKSCVECHSSPHHQNVVKMPHPAEPTCDTCHT